MQDQHGVRALAGDAGAEPGVLAHAGVGTDHEDVQRVVIRARPVAEAGHQDLVNLPEYIAVDPVRGQDPADEHRGDRHRDPAEHARNAPAPRRASRG